MRVALVHDWLNGMRGGEKVLEQLCRMYPDAVIHTLLYMPERVSETIRRMRVRTSFIQRMPFWETKYRWYLPLFPYAVERFDLSEFDLVISSSHCCALGAPSAAGAVHVCYCHTPMRYAWEHYDLYFPPERFDPVTRLLIAGFMKRLRNWDWKAARRVNMFVANSRCVADRIGKHYGRVSRVVYPPVDVEFFTPGGEKKDYFLVVSALVPYKRIDLAVRAFSERKLPLVVVGEGPERARLSAMAGPTVRFLGWQSDEAVREHYRAARALVFPGEEDFGLTPLEAAACGTPTIALAKGGALETVEEGLNGVFFDEESEDGLGKAVEAFSRIGFDAVAQRKHAERFSVDRFKSEMGAAVREGLSGAGR